MMDDSKYFQYQSGQFMWIYYMITWIILGVSCVCSCLGGVIAACAK